VLDRRQWQGCNCPNIFRASIQLHLQLENCLDLDRRQSPVCDNSAARPWHTIRLRTFRFLELFWLDLPKHKFLHLYTSAGASVARCEQPPATYASS